jgi:hypothetical protein
MALAALVIRREILRFMASAKAARRESFRSSLDQTVSETEPHRGGRSIAYFQKLVAQACYTKGLAG